MMIIYIIIGYIISVSLSIISDILFILLLDEGSKKGLKNAETIGELFKEIHPCCWIPIFNVAICFSNILLGSLILLYKILTTLRSKFLNIRIRKNNKNK